MKEKLAYLDYIQKDYTKKIKVLKEDGDLNKIDAQQAHEYCSKLSCDFITIFCKEYPNALKLLHNPPLVIYYVGDITILNSSQIAIIGSRYNTDYGSMYVKKLCKKIKGYTITSGYAYGIDQLAHLNALKNGLKTIAVLGGGFNNIYPNNNNLLFEEIKKNHLIITEYPPHIPPKPWQFLMRNRLIAGLSSKILVIEANIKSGSLKTVEVGIEQNKEIYALPGNVFSLNSSGTNLLIEEGANLLTTDSEFNI